MRLKLILSALIFFLFIPFAPHTHAQYGECCLWDVSWSPDSTQLAIAYYDAVYVLDIETNIPTQIYEATGIHSIAWSPLGDRLAVISGRQPHTFRIIDTGGTILLELASFDYADQYISATWSPDGQFIAAYVSRNSGSMREGWVEIWNMPTGDFYASYPGLGGGIAWSPDGKYLAALGNSLHIVNLETNEILYLDNDDINGLDWNADSSILVTSHGNGTNQIRFWDLSGDIIKTIDVGTASEVAWSPDGLYVTTISSTELNVWDYQTGFNAHHQFINSSGQILKWSPDGNFIAYASEEDIEILDVSTIIAQANPQPFIVAIEWSPDSTQIAVNYDSGGTKIIDVVTRKVLVSIPEPHNVTQMAWSPDGSRLAIGAQAVCIFDPVTGEQLNQLAGGTAVYSLAWNADSTRIAVSAQNGLGSSAQHYILVWDVATGIEIAYHERPRIGTPSDGNDIVAWSPTDDRLVIANSDYPLMLMDAATGETLFEFQNDTTATAAIWSPDGSQIAAAHGLQVRVWDAKLTGLLHELDLSALDLMPIWTLAWHPDGDYIAIGAYNELYLWDLATGDIHVVATEITSSVDDVSWSPDGDMLAYDNGGSLVIISDLELAN